MSPALAPKAAKEARCLQNFAAELNMYQLIKPIDVYSDSQDAIAMTYNPVNRSTTKHIALADHYVREQQEEGMISVSLRGVVTYPRVRVPMFLKSVGVPCGYPYVGTVPAGRARRVPIRIFSSCWFPQE